MAKSSTQKRSWLLKWGVLATGAMLFYAAFGDKGLLHLHHLQLTEEKLATKVANLEAENLRLEREIKSLSNPRYLEKVARKELGYIRSNEVIFYPPQQQ